MSIKHLERLDLVHPELAAFVDLLAEAEQDWVVVTGIRTPAQVTVKWAEGRTTPGPHAGEPGYPELGETVTEVRTLQSAPHAIRVTPQGLYGCAVDVQYLLPSGKLSEGGTAAEQAVYLRMGQLAEAHGLRWGGRFKRVDQAHVELVAWRSYPLPNPDFT